MVTTTSDLLGWPAVDCAAALRDSTLSCPTWTTRRRARRRQRRRRPPAPHTANALTKCGGTRSDRLRATDSRSPSVLLITTGGQIYFDLGIRAEAAWLCAVEPFLARRTQGSGIEKNVCYNLAKFYLGSQISGPSVWAVK